MLYKNQFSSTHPNALSLIDFCKGLAIAWVVLFHYSKNWFGWQGVHIFIVLSGFGLTYSCLNRNGNISWRKWYIKRAEKILPTYWLVSTFGFLFLVYINSHKDNAIANLTNSLVRFTSDLLLLRNFSYQLIFNYPNDQLWFVPLIFSLYMVFPVVYQLVTKVRKTENYLLILLGALLIEFSYRAISIYLLDGAPVGFQISFFNSLTPLEPLNRIPDVFFFPFQLQAPFGLFPARIAEFVIGIIGAAFLVDNKHFFNKIFSPAIFLSGVFIWATGYALVYIGLQGWIFASFFIAIGVTIWTVNLAWFCQQNFPYLFSKVSYLGKWSYYIFLAHSMFIYIFDFRVFTNIEASLLNRNLFMFFIVKILVFSGILVGTSISSWLLIQFDNSRFSKLIVQKSIVSLLN